MYRVQINLYSVKRSHALSLLTLYCPVSKQKLFEHYSANKTLIGIVSKEQLIDLLGHISLDRITRSRVNNDLKRVIWVEVLDKIPDNSYQLKNGEMDLRHKSKVIMSVRPITEELAEFRKLAA